MAAYVLCLCLLVLQVVHGNEQRKDGIINHLTNVATDFLTSESVALKVAEFVVRAFQTGNNPHPKPNRRRPVDEDSIDISSEETSNYEQKPDYDVNDNSSPMTPLRHLVRLFGLQPNQISAVAVNALVFVAQMISTFLAGPKRPARPYRTEDPADWILSKNSRRLQDILAAAKNESLPETIEDLIKDQGSEEETSCIRLFVCKITPFVSRMQKVVFGKDNEVGDDVDGKLRGSAVLYRHLPSAEEINSRNDVCERRHRDCDLNE